MPTDIRKMERAHYIVNVAKSKGSLTVQPCEKCGSIEKVHAHHEDYSKPLEVRWLCPRHHRMRHKEIGAPLGRMVNGKRQVHIDEDQYLQLEDRRKVIGISVAESIRRAVAKDLKENPILNKPDRN
jgi:uncharacterized Zn finger protein